MRRLTSNVQSKSNEAAEKTCFESSIDGTALNVGQNDITGRTGYAGRIFRKGDFDCVVAYFGDTISAKERTRREN